MNGQAYLRGRAVLAEEFEHEWLDESVRVASLCTFSLEELKYEYPREVVPDGETPASHLRRLTYAGAGRRYPNGLPEKVRLQIEHELKTIAKLEDEPYFLTVADIVHWARDRMRAELDAHDLKCLSGADALRPLAGNRPDAIWAAKGIDTRPTKMLREARTFEDPVEFTAPEEGDDVVDDYATVGLSLRRHPLALVRPQLARWRIKTAEELRRSAKDRQVVRASGIVTHRQRPSTANGVVFATLPDHFERTL